MSATRQTTIWCDGPLNNKTCVEWDMISGTPSQVRDDLARRGWVRRKSYDLCPKCAEKEIHMIRLRLATEAGFQEITPHSLTHCAGCSQEYYLDGPADPDPHFCCEVYDKRTDRKRLPECIQATDPVIVERMRLAARHSAYGRAVVVSFPLDRRPLSEVDVSLPIVHRTLRFEKTVCECNYHGEFWVVLLPGEKPFCPICVREWLEEMRRAHIHRGRG